MDMLSKIGRYLFALPLGIFGLFHFMNGSQMAAMVPIPGGIFWIYLTGAALLAACISILINTKARLACLLLGVMLLVFVLTIHLPGIMAAESQQAMQTSMTMLLKDTVMAGGAWVLAGTFRDNSDGNTGKS